MPRVRSSNRRSCIVDHCQLCALGKAWPGPARPAGCRNWDGVIGLGLPSRAVVANVRVCESWDGKLIGSSASKLS